MSLERRQSDRMLAEPGDVEHTVHRCFDISEIGMKFHTSQEVTRGDTFTIQVNTIGEPMSVVCRVVWCRDLVTPEDERYHFGVTFDGFTNAKQLRLRELISSRAAT